MLQLLELLRDSAAETVGIDVENAEICEKAELLGEIAGNVAVVEINSGDGPNRRVVERRSTEDSGVVADTRSDPISGEILGI